MRVLRTAIAVTWLNLKSLPRRAASALVVVAAIACVVGVLLSMLSVTIGLRNAWNRAGSPDRVLFQPPGSQAEGGPITRANAAIIQDLPGIVHDAKGAAIVDGEYLTSLPAPRRNTGHRGYILLRTFGPRALELRPEFHIIAGRMYQPGRHELVVGAEAPGQFAGVGLGDKVIMPDGLWPVVGVFKTNDDVVQAELVGDSDTVMAAMRQASYSSVIARLAGPGALATVKRALANNPALALNAERHSDYYLRRSSSFSDLNDDLAYGVSGLLGLGALLAAVNILYSGVNARRQEIATLRALGFSGFAVAISVAAEALLLAAAGAAIGAATAYGLFNGAQDIWYNNVFHLTVTPAMIGFGFGWALLIGLLGGVVPAFRAANLPVALGLRPD
jgi:putative ABC transport system permease protein